MATTVTVFNQQVRTDGTFTSSSASWDGAQGNGTGVFVLPTSTQAAWTAFTGTAEFQAQWSFDGGATWTTVADQTFAGNTWGKGGPPTMPSFSFQVQDGLGSRLVRAIMIITGSGSGVRIGLQVTLDQLI
jgi:hypothetical protein